MKGSRYKITVGLEVHVHLKTVTKLFCRCANEYAAEPNSCVCPVCTGQPGALPVTGEACVKQAVKAALALNCNINEYSVFERKQYFYPDLPKNYQVSQYEKPLAQNGFVVARGKKIEVERVHMEEDAGKLMHRGGETFVDLNRCGAALIEIVSAPVITSPSRAGEYLRSLRKILRYAGVSDCDMEKGSMRCDANLSLNLKESVELGVKTEVKNLNSFKAVESALSYEAKRQEKLLQNGEKVIQQTRLWDEEKNITRGMRSKEEAHDYRYFPEPDLPPLLVSADLLEESRREIPELPHEKIKRFVTEIGLSEYDAEFLCREREGADFFEKAYEKLKDRKTGLKKLLSWINTELKGKMNSVGIDFSLLRLDPVYLGELINSIVSGKISGKMAKEIFEIMWDKNKSPLKIIEEKGMSQISGEEKIADLCEAVIRENPKLAEKYLKGKEGVIGPLVGGVMKKTRGRANPNIVNAKLRQILDGKK
ncbi:MAG: Asp-tRNA(Asn)/Glu-tRNA(Gln) amidotransferase subunit GatB [Elusimicrobiota bacterium]